MSVQLLLASFKCVCVVPYERLAFSPKRMNSGVIFQQNSRPSCHPARSSLTFVFICGTLQTRFPESHPWSSFFLSNIRRHLHHGKGKTGINPIIAVHLISKYRYLSAIAWFFLLPVSEQQMVA